MSTNGTNGTNGTSTPSVVTVSELETKLARYRTALVALVDVLRREGGYRSWNDQLLLREVERLLEADAPPPIKT